MVFAMITRNKGMSLFTAHNSGYTKPLRYLTGSWLRITANVERNLKKGKI
jgi:hypothetical protein